MNKFEQMMRQKVSHLDTPPPQTEWCPERSWEKLQEKMTTEKLTHEKPAGRGYYVAAAFVILLVPFAVLVTDIWQQQEQINRLSSELTKERNKQPFLSNRQKASSTQAEAGGVMKKTFPADAPVKSREEKMGTRLPSPNPAISTGPGDDKLQGDALPGKEPQTELLVYQPETTQPGPTNSATKDQTVPEAKSRLVRIVTSGPKRKATSVTLYFPGTPDTAQQEMVAQETAPKDPKRFLRIFTHRRNNEPANSKPEEPIDHPLTIITAKK